MQTARNGTYACNRARRPGPTAAATQTHRPVRSDRSNGSSQIGLSLPNLAVYWIKRRRCAASGPALPAPGSGLGRPRPARPRRPQLKRRHRSDRLIDLCFPGRRPRSPLSRIAGTASMPPAASQAIGIRRALTRCPLIRILRLRGRRVRADPQNSHCCGLASNIPGVAQTSSSAS
jgi:hypothetical protein